MIASTFAFVSSHALAFLCLGGAALSALCLLGARAATAGRSERAASHPEPLDMESWIGAEGHLHAEAQAFVAALQDEARALARVRTPESA